MYRLLRAYSKQYLVLLFDQSVFSEKEYRHHEESCFLQRKKRKNSEKACETTFNASKCTA